MEHCLPNLRSPLASCLVCSAFGLIRAKQDALRLLTTAAALERRDELITSGLGIFGVDNPVRTNCNEVASTFLCWYQRRFLGQLHWRVVLTVMSPTASCVKLGTHGQRCVNRLRYVALSARRARAVYHYTDAAGLLGIVKNKFLWASDVWFMNDAREALYGLDTIEQALESLDMPPGSPRVEVRRRALSWLRAIRDQEDSFLRSYIACLSFVGDDLSQWRAYGQP